jgi:hypothetical protein
MIDRAWWRAAGNLPYSFLREGEGAFARTNGQDFYSYMQANKPFQQRFLYGMAAISWYEDKDVAETMMKLRLLEGKEAVIDVGGGDAGLLRQLHRAHQGAIKSQLFERDRSEDQKEQLTQEIAKRHGAGFAAALSVSWGDFFAANSIPDAQNTTYLIKCCLHNYKRIQIVQVLRRIYEAMTCGAGCNLVVAERVMPAVSRIPHTNRLCDVLMRFLFKTVESRDQAFYTEVIQEAGFKLSSGIGHSGRYLVLDARPSLAGMGERLPHTANKR